LDISLTGVQDQFRHYLSLVNSQIGVRDESTLEALRAQGGIIPVIDGVQFGPGESTLYIIIDALSRRPLFAKEMKCRGAKELAPFIAQLKELDVPLIAVVSDKEKGLVPAIETALPGVKHQYCQKHYLDQIALPMDEDLKVLAQEVRKVEESLRGVERELERKQELSGPISREVLVDLCMAARAEARQYGRATTAPPALKRHDGLERVANTVAEIQSKKRGLHISPR
jgi:hypothetical protein